MRIVDINHVAIKTLDLDATNAFYTDVLGMKKAYRPDFDFPGSWLQMGGTMIHVMAGHAAVDKNGKFSRGGAAVDHISIMAEGFDSFRDNFKKRGMDWREFGIPEAGIWQLFVKDPNGILIELNFETKKEPQGSRGYDAARKYEPGQY